MWKALDTLIAGLVSEDMNALKRDITRGWPPPKESVGGGHFFHAKGA